MNYAGIFSYFNEVAPTELENLSITFIEAGNAYGISSVGASCFNKIIRMGIFIPGGDH